MTSCDVEVNEVPTDRLRIPPASKGSNDKQQQESKSNPPQVTATDVLPRDLQTKDSNALVNYAVEVFNKDGRSAGLSNQVQISLVPTLPSPTGLHAELTADGVALAWGNVRLESEISGASYKYRVYRRPEGTNADVLVGEVPQSKSPLIRFQDRSFAWEKTYVYRVTMVTMLSLEEKPQVQVEGNDSAPVTVVAHDVFPPATPAGLQAVFSGIGQKPFVDLTWAPNTDADLVGYKMYRREDGGNWVLLNADLLKTPAFRDGNVASGRNYEYAITAVDLRGNESARSEGAREAVPQ
jgi:fibronectin type 3 domain-containing protein